MLTILHDQISINGQKLDVARACGEEIRSSVGATRRMAKRLLNLGHDPSIRVRVVREDPILFGPPYQVDMTLALAALVDPFAPSSFVPDELGPDALDRASVETTRSAVGR